MGRVTLAQPLLSQARISCRFLARFLGGRALFDDTLVFILSCMYNRVLQSCLSSFVRVPGVVRLLAVQWMLYVWCYTPHDERVGGQSWPSYHPVLE